MFSLEERFDEFWHAYPKRNGKKLGRKICWAWFKKEMPSLQTVTSMLEWLEIDNKNRAHFDRQGEFYSNLPDPIRFLKNWTWEDDIELVVPKKSYIEQLIAGEIEE